MAVQRGNLATGFQIPELYCAVRIARSQRLSIWQESQSANAERMAFKRPFYVEIGRTQY
jgi:hypothetical protein